MTKSMLLPTSVAVMCLGILLSFAIRSLSAEEVLPEDIRRRILSADDKDHAREIKQILGYALPEGYKLELTEIQRMVLGIWHVQWYRASAYALDSEGRRDGVARLWNPTRLIPYEKGKLHGVEKVYEGANLAQEIPWENDRRHGVMRSYFPDGKLRSEATYEHGKQVGESITYDTSGNVVERIPYKDGKMHGERVSYYGKVTRKDLETFVHHTEIEEVVAEYNKMAGNKRRVVTYKNGKAHGAFCEFHRNGNISREMHYRNDELHGVERNFNEEGEELRVRYWLDGEIVPRAQYEAHAAQDNY